MKYNCVLDPMFSISFYLYQWFSLTIDSNHYNNDKHLDWMFLKFCEWNMKRTIWCITFISTTIIVYSIVSWILILSPIHWLISCIAHCLLRMTKYITTFRICKKHFRKRVHFHIFPQWLFNPLQPDLLYPHWSQI
jgi:hypothetical protein